MFNFDKFIETHQHRAFIISYQESLIPRNYLPFINFINSCLTQLGNLTKINIFFFKAERDLFYSQRTDFLGFRHQHGQTCAAFLQAGTYDQADRLQRRYSWAVVTVLLHLKRLVRPQMDFRFINSREGTCGIIMLCCFGFCCCFSVFFPVSLGWVYRAVYLGSRIQRKY